MTRTGQPVRLSELTAKSVVSVGEQYKGDPITRYVYKDADGWFVYLPNDKLYLATRAGTDGDTLEGVSWG